MKIFRLAAALTFLVIPLTGCYHNHRDDHHPPPPPCDRDHPCHDDHHDSIGSLAKQRAGASDDHRTAPVLPEQLWRIVEDPAPTA